MKLFKMLTVVYFLLFLPFSRMFSQSFTIDVSPSTVSLSQNLPLTLSVTGIPSGGYNASIQISIVNTCFDASDITITPAFLNPPYNGQIQVSNFDRYVPGYYSIVVKGENGSVTSYDTVGITIQPSLTSEWYHYNLNKFGFSGYYHINDVKIDSQNNYWYAVEGNSADNGGLVKYTGTILETWRNGMHYVYDLCGKLLGSNASPVIPFYGGAYCMEIDAQDNIWFYEKTNRKLTKFSQTLGIVYQSTPFNFTATPSYMNMIPVDFAAGTFYFASDAGLIYFDGTVNSVYSTSNSAIPANTCRDLVMDNTGAVWITTAGGLAKLQGGFWTVYTTSNSTLGSNDLGSVVFDQQNELVFIGANGINKFANNNFSVMVPGMILKSIQYDANKSLWGASYFSLRKIDTLMNVTVYDSINTLKYKPYDSPNHLAIDQNNNIVVAAFQTLNGQYADIMIRNPRYVAPVGLKNNFAAKEEPEVYPNPATNEIKIKGLASGSYLLKLYDFKGTELKKENLQYAGEDQTIVLSATSLPTGIYMLQVSNGLRSYTKKLMIE